ncbi:MAG: ApeP family dehydratase [Methylophilus sp.]|uniref:ApeP family dehydratase n=1 Tax=Methylophilus sp. TaxID=29541 RepID=UPI003F9F7FC7
MNPSDIQVLPDVSELLMHRPPMLLLDQADSFDAESVTMLYTPDTQAWYADAEGNMPAWIGIELMAQAIGCHVALNKRLQQQPPKQGVLLGSRRYLASVPVFIGNRQLRIQAVMIFRDESGLAAYDCTICEQVMAGDNEQGQQNERAEKQPGETANVLASATLKVFEPDNFQQFLQGAGS